MSANLTPSRNKPTVETAYVLSNRAYRKRFVLSYQPYTHYNCCMNESRERQQQANGGVRFVVLNVIAVLSTAVITFALLLSTHAINVESDALQQAYARFAACETAMNNLMESSTYLTTQSRLFATTYHTAYLDNYFWKMSNNQQRENDAALLREYYPGSDVAEYAESAYEFAEKLSKNELYAMKLVVTALDLEVDENIAATLDEIQFLHGDEHLSHADMLDKAHLLVTYEPYEHDVDRVTQQIERCKDELAATLEAEELQHSETLEALFTRQKILTVALLVIVLSAGIAFIFIITRPINEYIAQITRNEPLVEKGAYELRFLARAYNTVFEENQNVNERLTFEAEHDSLTGLYNRGAFDEAITEQRKSPMVLAILDIDHFKEVNDKYGHNIGDLVLQRVASLLTESFQPEGTPYRLGGDEFVVILPGHVDDLRETVIRDARTVSDRLAVAHGEIPAVGISAGVAFGDGTQVSGELYKLADQALYRVKGEGRRGIAFASEDSVHPF